MPQRKREERKVIKKEDKLREKNAVNKIKEIRKRYAKKRERKTGKKGRHFEGKGRRVAN